MAERQLILSDLTHDCLRAVCNSSGDREAVSLASQSLLVDVLAAIRRLSLRPDVGPGAASSLSALVVEAYVSLGSILDLEEQPR